LDPDTINTTNWLTSKWTTMTGTLGVQNSSAFGTASDVGIAVAGMKIADVYNNAYAANAGFSSVVVSSFGIGSWSKNDPFNSTTAKLDASVKNGSTDLYVAASDGVSGTYEFLGTFNISSSGDLTYTVAAIPEPSTYAVILGALTIGFGAFRRCFVKAV
jgi:hypothetical protein